MPGAVTFTPAVEDWVSANRLWYRRSRQRRWISWLAVAGLVLASGSIGFGLFQGHSLTWALKDSGAMLVFAVLLVLSPLLTSMAVPRSVRRMFAQRPSLTDPITIDWDDDRLMLTGASGHTIQPWATLHRWVSDDRSIVLLPSDRMLLLVPTRALGAAQAADLIGTLRRRAPREG